MRRQKGYMHMQLSTDGIVLKEGELRENDKVLTILTQDYGLITAFANGARRLNSRLAAGASFLCYSDMRLFFNKGKYVLDDAFPKNIFYGIREDIESLSLASYLSELAQALAPVGDAAGDFLRLTLNTLHMLEKKKRPLAFLKAVFELRMISMAGYMPDLLGCMHCGAFDENSMYFSIAQAGLVCQNCYKEQNAPQMLALSSGVLGAMRYILYSQMEKLFSFAISAESLKKLSFICEKYVQFTLDRTFKTLDFYNSLFSN